MNMSDFGQLLSVFGHCQEYLPSFRIIMLAFGAEMSTHVFLLEEERGDVKKGDGGADTPDDGGGVSRGVRKTIQTTQKDANAPEDSEKAWMAFSRRDQKNCSTPFVLSVVILFCRKHTPFPGAFAPRQSPYIGLRTRNAAPAGAEAGVSGPFGPLCLTLSFAPFFHAFPHCSFMSFTAAGTVTVLSPTEPHSRLT
jgi:hypothetical protein